MAEREHPGDLAEWPAAETLRRLAHAILAHQGRAPRDDATTD